MSKAWLPTGNAVAILVFLVHVLLSVRSHEMSHQREGGKALCFSSALLSSLWLLMSLTLVAKELWGQLGCEGECPRVGTSQPSPPLLSCRAHKKWSTDLFVSKKLL